MKGQTKKFELILTKKNVTIYFDTVSQCRQPI